MLPLESPRWSELQHANGAASDIPSLLHKLLAFPDETSYENEPWFTLWSVLTHQGDVFPASFAAVPHVIAALATGPSRASMSYFFLPATVEVARISGRVEIPVELQQAYFAALTQLPQLTALAAKPDWSPELCRAALAATAAATGNHLVAKLLMQTESDSIPEILEWLEAR